MSLDAGVCGTPIETDASSPFCRSMKLTDRFRDDAGIMLYVTEIQGGPKIVSHYQIIKNSY